MAVRVSEIEGRVLVEPRVGEGRESYGIDKGEGDRVVQFGRRVQQDLLPLLREREAALDSIGS